MLHNDTINRLMKRFEQSTSYRITIIDSHGIIIAGSDKARIGTFHKKAHHIIANGQSVFTCPCSPDGSEGAVILTISLGNAIEGALELLGIPEETLEPAKLLKAAIEDALEMQARYRWQSQQSTLRSRFCEQLLYAQHELPFHTAPPDLSHLKARAKMLGYSSDCPRIPIMVFPFKEQYQDLVEKLFRDNAGTSSQEILLRPAGIQTLVFLRLQTTPRLCGTYREQVEDYLYPILAQLEKNNIQYQCAIGSIQNQLDQYQASFQHCMWTVKAISANRTLNSIVYFYDYLREYLHSRIVPDEFTRIFDAFTQYEPESFWTDYIPIITAMNQHQNNMIKSSEALHMHKNTLAYRYNQIRNQLALNPLQSAADDFFTAELCRYLQNR